MENHLAPPSFSRGNKLIVPINVHRLEIVLSVDIPNKVLSCAATTSFSPLLDGYPMLDLVPRPEGIWLNGTQLPASALPEVTPPDGEAQLRYLDATLSANSEHVLSLNYGLDANTVLFESGGVRIGFFLNDLVERGFLERYAPANFEFDQFPIIIAITLAGATDTHRLFSNGHVLNLGENSWRVECPSYFTSSSLFLHLTNRPLAIRQGVFEGQEAAVPVEVYSNDADVADQALTEALAMMEELERDYGPYAHEKMVIYVADSLEPPLAGMEYCGATMTELPALGHEITHSWFGRGVMPGKGSAGWIDEAIARWRDYGYPRASGPPNRDPVNLADFSPYRRNTTTKPNPYSWGSLLLSELDFLLREDGGLKPVLGKLYRENMNTVIDTSVFLEFLKQETPLDLDKIFERYVYGRSGSDSFLAGRDYQRTPLSLKNTLEKAWGQFELQPFPRPFTQEKLRELL